MSLIIGVLGRPNMTDRKVITFSQAIIDVINSYNAIPLGIIPSNRDITLNLDDNEKNKLLKMIDLCDGIILQGGKDYYAYDIEAIKYIDEKNIPVLGICLGEQSLVIATDGNLDFVDNHRHIDVNDAHEVRIDKHSKLYSIIKEERIRVNSRHKEAVVNPGDYKVVGWSSDNVIEAVELSDAYFNIGVQWHPEDLVYSDEPTQRLFNAFFEACYKYNKNK